MKKAILILLVVLITSCVTTEKSVDLPGVGSFTYEEENEYYDEFYTFIQDFTDLINGDAKIDVLLNYLDTIDEYSLLDLSIRDSILLYTDFEYNTQLFNKIDSIDSSGQNELLQFIKTIRKESGNYINSSFNYSTFLLRRELDFGISLMLPDTYWEKIDYKDVKDIVFYQGGEDTYAGTVSISVTNVAEGYNVVKDHYYSTLETMLLTGMPEGGLGDITDENVYKVAPGKIELIDKDIVVGGRFFDYVYEQVTVNPKEYNFQNLAAVTRFYLDGNRLYTVTVQSIIAGEHIFSDTEYLARQHKLLLDSVKFQ